MKYRDGQLAFILIRYMVLIQRSSLVRTTHQKYQEWNCLSNQFRTNWFRLTKFVTFGWIGHQDLTMRRFSQAMLEQVSVVVSPTVKAAMFRVLSQIYTAVSRIELFNIKFLFCLDSSQRYVSTSDRLHEPRRPTRWPPRFPRYAKFRFWLVQSERGHSLSAPFNGVPHWAQHWRTETSWPPFPKYLSLYHVTLGGRASIFWMYSAGDPLYWGFSTQHRLVNRKRDKIPGEEPTEILW